MPLERPILFSDGSSAAPLSGTSPGRLMCGTTLPTRSTSPLALSLSTTPLEPTTLFSLSQPSPSLLRPMERIGILECLNCQETDTLSSTRTSSSAVFTSSQETSPLVLPAQEELPAQMFRLVPLLPQLLRPLRPRL